MRNQKGFTLIELIIVIVVLGILAVTAAPQFIDFSSDARTSTVKGLKGSLQGASQTVYSKAAVNGELDQSYFDVNEDDVDDTGSGPDISLLNGYPEDTAAGIVRAAQLNAQDATDSDITSDWIYSVISGGANDSILIAPADIGDGTSIVLGDSCYVRYIDAESSNEPPQITSKVAGC